MAPARKPDGALRWLILAAIVALVTASTNGVASAIARRTSEQERGKIADLQSSLDLVGRRMEEDIREPGANSSSGAAMGATSTTPASELVSETPVGNEPAPGSNRGKSSVGKKSETSAPRSEEKSASGKAVASTTQPPGEEISLPNAEEANKGQEQLTTEASVAPGSSVETTTTPNAASSSTTPEPEPSSTSAPGVSHSNARKPKTSASGTLTPAAGNGASSDKGATTTTPSPTLSAESPAESVTLPPSSPTSDASRSKRKNPDATRSPASDASATAAPSSANAVELDSQGQEGSQGSQELNTKDQSSKGPHNADKGKSGQDNSDGGNKGQGNDNRDKQEQATASEDKGKGSDHQRSQGQGNGNRDKQEQATASEDKGKGSDHQGSQGQGNGNRDKQEQATASEGKGKGSDHQGSQGQGNGNRDKQEQATASEDKGKGSDHQGSQGQGNGNRDKQEQATASEGKGKGSDHQGSQGHGNVDEVHEGRDQGNQSQDNAGGANQGQGKKDQGHQAHDKGGQEDGAQKNGSDGNTKQEHVSNGHGSEASKDNPSASHHSQESNAPALVALVTENPSTTGSPSPSTSDTRNPDDNPSASHPKASKEPATSASHTPNSADNPSTSHSQASKTPAVSASTAPASEKNPSASKSQASKTSASSTPKSDDNPSVSHSQASKAPATAASDTLKPDDNPSASHSQTSKTPAISASASPKSADSSSASNSQESKAPASSAPETSNSNDNPSASHSQASTTPATSSPKSDDNPSVSHSQASKSPVVADSQTLAADNPSATGSVSTPPFDTPAPDNNPSASHSQVSNAPAASNDNPSASHSQAATTPAASTSDTPKSVDNPSTSNFQASKTPATSASDTPNSSDNPSDAHSQASKSPATSASGALASDSNPSAPDSQASKTLVTTASQTPAVENPGATRSPETLESGGTPASSGSRSGSPPSGQESTMRTPSVPSTSTDVGTASTTPAPEPHTTDPIVPQTEHGLTPSVAPSNLRSSSGGTTSEETATPAASAQARSSDAKAASSEAPSVSGDDEPHDVKADTEATAHGTTAPAEPNTASSSNQAAAPRQPESTASAATSEKHVDGEPLPAPDGEKQPEKASATSSASSKHDSAEKPSKAPGDTKSKSDHKATDTVEALTVDTGTSVTQDAKQYVRGDDTQQSVLAGGSGTFEGDDVAGASGEPLVIGGRKRGWQASAQSGLYAVSSRFHNILRFSTCVAALLSVALLLAFHFEALNDRLACHFPVGSSWSPNTWEFVLYVGYIQQISAFSAMTLLQTPYFLWDFTDLFAWTNFLIYRAQDDLTSSSSGSDRRLTTIILGGLVGYGDRIGTNESVLLCHVCAGFALVALVFLVLAFGANVLGRWHRGDNNRGRSVSLRCLGLAVLVWFFGLFPLSMAVSFEISMELQARVFVLPLLLLAFAVVIAGFFGVVALAGRAILHRTDRELLAFWPRAVWGTFYLDYSYPGRLFFLLSVTLQIAMGLCIGMLDANETMLLLLIALHMVFIAAVFVMQPFLDRSTLAKRSTYAVNGLKIANLGLAFAFLPSANLGVSGLFRAANVFVGVNGLVIVIWSLRHLAIFGTLVVALRVREGGEPDEQDEERRVEASPANVPSYELATKPR